MQALAGGLGEYWERQEAGRLTEVACLLMEDIRVLACSLQDALDQLPSDPHDVGLDQQGDICVSLGTLQPTLLFKDSGSSRGVPSQALDSPCRHPCGAVKLAPCATTYHCVSLSLGHL